MSELNRPTSALYERPAKRRPAGARLGNRLAKTFAGLERAREEAPGWEPDGEYEYVVEDHTQGPQMPDWDAEDRFPRTRHGYDPVAVDETIDQLENEIETLRERKPSAAVAAEIEKIGEQTSSILLAAHDQASKIKREAQEQADRCLADAAANAVQMTEEAKRKLAQLDTETESVWQERDRLLTDARNVASQLVALVESAATRFPAEPERTPAPSPAPVTEDPQATASFPPPTDSED